MYMQTKLIIVIVIIVCDSSVYSKPACVHV